MSRILPRTLLAILALTLGACASNPQSSQDAAEHPEPVFSEKRILPADFETDQADVYDPWEGMNKRIYNFNYHFDKHIFLPAVRGYRWIMPDFAETGVHNFFANFNDMITMMNSVLQAAPQKFVHSTGRVLVNSTVGILGLVDVASMWDIPRPVEDFGQTLGYWGVDQGPYLVLPFLGPSNLRDGVGMLPDFYVRSLIQDEVLSDDVRMVTTVLWPLDTRSNTSFRYYETGSAFEYRMVRWLWSSKRELDVIQ